MKRVLFIMLLLSITQLGFAADTNSATSAPKTTIKAFPTKDASVNMNDIKKNPVFAERYSKLEATYKEVLMRLQQEERDIQQKVKAGELNEAQLYGKSQEFEFEFRNAQKKLQDGAMELEGKVNDIISNIIKEEGWDGCQVQMFGYVNPNRDITPRVIKALEEKLKAEDAAEKFKKPTQTTSTETVKATAQSTEKADNKPGIRPAPKKKSTDKKS